ncbi:hypothetical protein HMPREF1141_0033 [Clostridium sp. MSTE9]|nr:hypothetical protein HMPREF1141_0033 [Clostridium sp. MSTE9]
MYYHFNCFSTKSQFYYIILTFFHFRISVFIFNYNKTVMANFGEIKISHSLKQNKNYG